MKTESWVGRCLETRAQEADFAAISAGIKALEKDDRVDVSVVMVAFNEEKRILPALRSLSLQRCGDLSVEVIVVNNNSTDRTQELIDRCGVHGLFQPRKGCGPARQAGLEAARGKYHLCADADTLYPPAYVAGMVAALQRAGTIAVFAPPSFLPDGQKSGWSLAFYERFRNAVLWMRFRKRPELTVGAASLAFLTAPAREIGWRTDIRRGTDGALTMELKKRGKIRFVNRRNVRIKTTSRTLDADGSFARMIWIRLKKEWKRIPEYFTASKGYADREENKLK